MSARYSPCLKLRLVAAILVMTACGKDDPIAPPDGTLGIRAILASAVTDTIDAPVLLPLVAEVRGRDGRLAPGVIVRFESQTATNPGRADQATAYVCSRSTTPCPTSGTISIDTTDANGRAEASVRLGRLSGVTYVRMRAPEFGVVDSAKFTVSQGAAVGIRTNIKDTLINIGTTITIPATVVDRYGNARSESPVFTAAPENAVTLEAATGKITARDLGTQYVYARFATFTDSTKVRILPGGTLVVWSRTEGKLQLFNLGRSNIRTIATGLSAYNGAYPRFDPTGRHVTSRVSELADLFGESYDAIMVTDTAGERERYISPANGFQSMLTNRMMVDGSLLVVGRLVVSPATYSLYRVSTTGAITKVTDIPGLVRLMPSADISYDGARIAYLVPVANRLELRTLNVTTGVIAVLEPDARSPRWSHKDNRIAYLINSYSTGTHTGQIAIINADGSGRRTYGDIQFNPGFAWSPEDTFIIGGNPQTVGYLTTRLLRLSDGYPTLFAYLTPYDTQADYSQFDWQ